MRVLLFLFTIVLTFPANGQAVGTLTLPDSVTVIQEGAPFRRSPENGGEIIFRVKSGTKAALVDLINDHLKVRIDTAVGYMSYVFIDLKSPELKKYFDDYKRSQRMKLEAEKDSIAKETFRQEQLQKNAEFQQSLAELTKKYGPEIGKKIAFGHVWIGMSREMLIESRGYPLKINRTVTANVVNEQFVYHDQKYVYVENGKVKAWQD